MVRLGSVVLIVRLLVRKGKPDFSRTTNYTNFNTLASPTTQSNFRPRENVSCRICLEEERADDPFVNVCVCF